MSNFENERLYGSRKKLINKKTIKIISIIVGIVLLVVIGCLGAFLALYDFDEKEEIHIGIGKYGKIKSDSAAVGRRLNCLPDLEDDQLIKNECHKLTHCKYDPEIFHEFHHAPKCFYDTKMLKLKHLNQYETEFGKRHIVKTDIGTEKVLQIDFEFLTKQTMRFKIHPYNTSYEDVPLMNIKQVSSKAQERDYAVEINDDKNDFQFKIVRKSTGTILWDSTLNGLIWNDLHIQIATRLPSKNVYGFGENNHRSFRHKLDFQTWPIFTRDQIPALTESSNLYASQPFYTCMEDDGFSHGVVLVNSHALDYEFIPEPGLVYRATGGIFDFYVFLGPHPENVVQEYTEFFGRPFMPPYWALGFQISRYGYKDLDDMKSVLDRFKKYEIPLDTQVADIDHYDERKVFTVDSLKWNGLNEYFKEIEAQGMKTIMILDPFLVVNDSTYEPFSRGLENNVYVNWPKDYTNPDYNSTNSSVMLGYCWPKGKVAYPDFFKTSAKKWWIDEIMRHRENLVFHGLWIDMNEPAVFGTNEDRPFNWPEDDKPYWSLKCPENKYETVKTKATYLHKADKLSAKTLCMIARQGDQDQLMHFDVHNIYGHSEAIVSYEAAQKATKTRGLVITRSSFIGTGQYAGTWTGDNDSKWSDLYYSIIGMMEFNLFGIPYVGSDICGFWYNATEQLCQRWQQLGAFYPFSRNHNGELNIDQDPGAFSPDVAESTRKVLNIRYEILPYYYTLFYKAHTRGNTVIRPLFHEFPTDANLYQIDRQFLVGSNILISPVLEENKTKLEAYMPSGLWYSYYDGQLFNKIGWTELDAPLDFIPIHIRGGSIIPTQEPANNTFFSRQKPFGLIVALNENGEARGDMFYDDGESLDFNAGKYYFSTFVVRSNTLEMNIEHGEFPGDIAKLKLNKIRLFMDKIDSPVSFVLNGKALNELQVQAKSNNEIVLSELGLPMDKPFSLSWFDYDHAAAIDSNETLVDCSVENKSITETDCKARSCLFNSQATNNVPKCTIPRGVGGYRLANNSPNGNDQSDLSTYSNPSFLLQKADGFSLYGKEIKNVLIKVTHGTSSGNFGVTRVKISDVDNEARYEVPIKLDFTATNRSNLNVNVKTNENLAYIEVKSKADVLLFDTKNVEHGFVFSDQFIQILLNTNYKNVYGFGENTHYSFKHRFEYTQFWPVFARDQPTGAKYLNYYGTHPFFMAVDENTGRAYGVLIFNSNAMEYGFLPPYVIAYRTTGGILDLYIMEEESPEKLIQAYTSLIGNPYMVPYWSLGFQLCRYGYNSIDNMKAVVERTRKAGIPQDVQYGDIDHFYKNLDFTYDPVTFNGLPDYINELNKTGIRFIIILVRIEYHK